MTDRYTAIMREASGKGSYQFKRIIATRLQELCEFVDGLETELFEFGCSNQECPMNKILPETTGGTENERNE